MKGAVDIELQEHYIGANHDEADGRSCHKQSTTTSGDSQKTSMAQSKSGETTMEGVGMHLQGEKPKASFQSAARGSYAST
jgi:hypothetical protein